ncbi:GNAT family acetyltransferase [Colletotrichum musicola]|uniref:GNAT family acetyltransferase n=2 Tax=Colletotrichum orchidearum species complex TaxID=2707337 RepID=A0A8H6KCV0_9PEZI|nr:GNAT family acetyltransferase [Colletotrichum plurivorum]KAF6828943.1 GNAT family acetyltransferase [Colletotrichum musicola]
MKAGSQCLKYVQKTAALKPPSAPRITPNHPLPLRSITAQRPLRPHTALHQAAAVLIQPPRLFSSSSSAAAMAKTLENTADGRPNISIRPATPDDAAAIAELGAHVFTVTFGYSVEPHELQAFLDESYTVEAVTKDLADPNKDTILAFDTTAADGGLLGFAMLTRGSSEPCVADLEATVELQRIYLYPKAHGTGVAKALADQLEDTARAEGFKHIWLGVWEENHRARRAYEKWGYKAVGTHDFVIGSVVQTDDILVKNL